MSDELNMMVLDQDLRFIEEAIKGLHELPGSPAYVRRLRDGMVARFLERHHREYADEWHSDYLPTAIERANDVVEALGYQVPEVAP